MPAKRFSVILFSSIFVFTTLAFAEFGFSDKVAFVSSAEAAKNKKRRSYVRKSHSNQMYLARKRHIQRYNNRVVRQNHLQSIRRSGAVLANPHMRNPYYGYSDGYAEYYDDGVSGVILDNVQQCPSKYNCGYRVYSDGTGPRIITPGIPAGNGLPPYDGISGPSIITPN